MKNILTLLEFKNVFDQEFFRYLAEKKAQAAYIDKKCTLLIDEIIRLNKAGGKRLRPYISYLGHCLTFDPGLLPRLQAGSFLMGIEMLHSFALIHDDIMDEAKIRRGQITAYKKFGRNKAILVGDMAISLADELIRNTSILAKQKYDQLKFEVICGQYLDIDQDKKISEKEILKILKYKSGLYTIARPLQIGYLSNISQKTKKQGGRKNLEILESYGESVGIAFQLRDDLLDLFAQPKIGKTVGGDVMEDKITYWLLKLQSSKARLKISEKTRLKQCLGNKKLTQKDIDWLKALLIKTGIEQECQQLIDDLIKRGQQAIINFSGNNKAKEKLMEIADFIGSRDY